MKMQLSLLQNTKRLKMQKTTKKISDSFIQSQAIHLIVRPTHLKETESFYVGWQGNGQMEIQLFTNVQKQNC